MGVLDAPNEGRELHATLDGVVYARHPVRTHLVTPPTPMPRPSSPATRHRSAMTCGWSRSASGWSRSPRAARTRSSEIRPGRLARLLERFVTRPGYGIGLGSAETMELAIREVGAPRILLAAAASAVTRPFGVHGVFYRVAGPQAKAIDGPTSYTIPPYNQAATLGPKRPRRRGTRASPPRSTLRSRSSTPTTPAAPCSAPVRASTDASSSASSPTTRSARPASRRRSASCARWRGRPTASCRPSRGGASRRPER